MPPIGSVWRNGNDLFIVVDHVTFSEDGRVGVVYRLRNAPESRHWVRDADGWYLEFKCSRPPSLSFPVLRRSL
jgi:hypothetical protein